MSDDTWRVLFVCSGNICRSPMAEVLARGYGEDIGRPVEARSAGTLGLEGYPADAHAIAVCAELGLDLGAHLSMGVTDDLVAWAHWIPVMTVGHAAFLREHHPAAGSKIVLLGSFAGKMDIADPIGRGRGRFRESRDEIRGCVEALLARLPDKKPR